MTKSNTKTIKITEGIARKVLEVVDAGLVNGVGKPIPGQMCVEAAVCYALGLPHGDDPKCVSPVLRFLKIRINDYGWSSDIARASGLRRLAVAQLGSAGVLDEKEFVRRLVDHAIRVSTPKALRIAADLISYPSHRDALRTAANRCEAEGTKAAANAAANAAYTAAYATAYAADADAAAYAAYAAANAAANADAAAYAAYAAANAAAYAAYAAATANGYAARDKSLAEYAEAVVQILIDMDAPGCRWLALTEAA